VVIENATRFTRALHHEAQQTLTLKASNDLGCRQFFEQV
jgi:hypothetical protein